MPWSPTPGSDGAGPGPGFGGPGSATSRLRGRPGLTRWPTARPDRSTPAPDPRHRCHGTSTRPDRPTRRRPDHLPPVLLPTEPARAVPRDITDQVLHDRSPPDHGTPATGPSAPLGGLGQPRQAQRQRGGREHHTAAIDTPEPPPLVLSTDPGSARVTGRPVEVPSGLPIRRVRRPVHGPGQARVVMRWRTSATSSRPGHRRRGPSARRSSTRVVAESNACPVSRACWARAQAWSGSPAWA
jgi:hypothetical protein